MADFDWNEIIVTNDGNIVNGQVMDRMILVTGEKGDDGKDGRSILTIEKTAETSTEDTYTINYSDGTRTNFSIDKPAPRSIASITKTSSGSSDIYTISYTDGTQYQFNVGNSTDVYTKSETDNIVNLLQTQINNINNYHIHVCTNEEFDQITFLPTIQNPDEKTFYLVPTSTGNDDIYDEWIYLNNQWERFGAAKDVSGVYTKSETDALIDGLQDQIDNINNFTIHICTSTEYDATTHIPTVSNPSETTFYLVPNGTGNDVYDEYIYTNNAWKKFGSTSIDLTHYYTKTQTDNLLSVKANESIVANEWSNVKTYNIGDVVIYNHELYKYTENVTSKVEPITIKVIHGKTTYYKDELLVYSNIIYKVLAESISYYGSDSSAPHAIQTWLNNGQIEIVDVKEYTSGETYQVGDIVKVDDKYYIVTVAGSPTEWNLSAVSKIIIIEALDEKANTADLGDLATKDAVSWGEVAGTLSNQTDLKNALDAKAPLASPALTGTPTAPTASSGTNSTQIATTAFVRGELNKEILYFYQQAVLVASSAQIMRIPASGTDPAITTDTVVLECTFANPAAITSDVTWTSYTGYITFNGTCTAATTANVTLGLAGNI